MTDAQASESSRVSIWPVTWKFSLIIAASLSIYSIFLYLTGLASSSILGFVSTIIFIVLLVIALKKFRGLNNGYMTFGQASLIGFVISIVSNVISSAVEAVFLAIAGGSILEAMLDTTKAALEQAGMDQQTYDAVVGIYEAVFTPLGIFIAGTCTGVFAGVIISLIVAAIVKNPPPVSE